VTWDGDTCELQPQDVGEEMIVLGNASPLGGIGHGEPFAILQTSFGCFLASSEAKDEHTVAIALKDEPVTRSYVQNYIEEYINSALGGDY
jgi:hypothetical protein